MRKGGGHFELHVTGKAAHAAEPEKGISAIQELAHQILALHSLTDMEKGTTVNGVVNAGTRSNVVAAEAHAIIDVRAWTQAEADRLANAIRSLQPVTPGA
ncbi:MAG: peptidase dimerization domain-containing protein [Caldilineaceae bacterium]